MLIMNYKDAIKIANDVKRCLKDIYHEGRETHFDLYNFSVTPDEVEFFIKTSDYNIYINARSNNETFELNVVVCDKKEPYNITKLAKTFPIQAIGNNFEDLYYKILPFIKMILNHSGL